MYASFHRYSIAALASACAAVLLAACGGASETATDTTAAGASASVMLPETSVVTSWTRCAVEYGTCTFSGTKEVRYGLGDKWATRTATGSIACNNAVFGDPYPGANKVCEYPTTTSAPAPAPAPGTTTWTRCATEYGTCSFSGTKEVRYGLGDKWATRTATGSIACNNAVFGDPYPGASKACEYPTTSSAPAPAPAPAPGTTTWTRCATEYGTCSFSGTKEVRYGLGDKWVTRTATGSIACNNAVFGDPYPGASKVCEYPSTASEPAPTPVPTPAPAPAPVPAPAPSTNWSRCATEYGTCSFSGTRQVRYGLGDKWAIRTATGSIACNNAVFGDPYPGASKVCDYEASTSTPSPSETTQVIEYYGDSTVWGYRTEVGGQVAKPAPVAFAEALPNPAAYIVRNEGVSGSTACDLLNGTDGKHQPWSNQMAASKARYVFVNHAINDEWKYDVNTYKSCLRSLAQTAKQYGKQMIFETPNPTRDSGSWGLDVYVNAMKEVATQESVPVIDQYKYLTDYLAGKSPYTICTDGLHPTDAVYIMKGKYAAGAFTNLFAK